MRYKIVHWFASLLRVKLSAAPNFEGVSVSLYEKGGRHIETRRLFPATLPKAGDQYIFYRDEVKSTTTIASASWSFPRGLNCLDLYATDEFRIATNGWKKL